MKKVFALLLAIMFVFSGCSTVSETLYFGGVANVEFEYTGKTGRDVSILLYYLNPLGKLKAESRTIELSDDDDLLYRAISEQLNAPKTEIFESVNFGVQLEYAELSEDVCNIYLTSGQKGDSLSVYTLGCALAGMIDDLFKVSHTCLFINGAPVYSGGNICQPFTKTTEVIAEEFKLAKSYDGEIDVVLYFPSQDGNYILPEVRTIYASQSQLLPTILDELKSGPKRSYMEPIFNSENTSSAQLSYRGSTLNLKFGKYPYVYTDMLVDGDSLYSAAVVYTLSGVVSAKINLDTVSSDLKALTRYDYRSFLGERIALYMPNSTYSMLTEVMHTAYQYDARRINTKINGLLGGPIGSDPIDVYPSLPAGISSSDFISVTIQDDMAVIDVTQNFFDILLNLSDNSEYMTIFSIVNTLTESDYISKVLFTVEGEQLMSREYYLYYGYPFTENPGINRS